MQRIMAATYMLLVAGVAGGRSKAPTPSAARDRVLPVSYWRFEVPDDLGRDSASPGEPLRPCRSSGPAAWRARPFSSGGIVGGYASINNATVAALGGRFPRSAAGATGVTVELLLKTGPYFQLLGNTSLFGALGQGGWVEAAVERHSLTFRADPVDASPQQANVPCFSEQDAVLPTAVPCSRLEVPLDQAGRRTMFYLADGDWHHIAFRKDAISGEQNIFIDGQCPDGFQHPQPNRSTGPAISQPQGLFTLLGSLFDGAIDEVALFDSALPYALIAQHHADAMAHKPYTTSLRPPFSVAAPTPSPVAGLLEAKEFAIGTVCPGWVSNCTPANCTASQPFQGAGVYGVTRGDSTQLDPLAQLQSFPSPRLVPSVQPQFGRNIAWFNYPWVLGVDSPVACPSCHNQSCVNAAGDSCWNSSSTRFNTDALQMEYATTWHYPLYASHDGINNESILKIYNAHPEIPIAHTISRGDVSTLGAPGGKPIDPSVVDRPECFLQNAAGELLMPSGLPRPSRKVCNESDGGGRCLLRPCISCEYDCGNEIAKSDAGKYASKWKEWQNWGLNRPIELLFDDGEYLGWYNNLAHALDLDPLMVSDYEKQQIPALPDGSRDWLTYTSRWRTKNTLTFNAVLLQDPSLPTFNATYGEYTVGGDTMYRPFKNDSWMKFSLFSTNGKWESMRAINSPGKLAHSDVHYGMSDYYPWNPDGRGCACGGTLNVPPQGQQALWDSAGAIASWDGLDFLSMARPTELAHGDDFFSPFIAPGWSEREEMNLRPAQTLGILKALFAVGAEYFHVGFFNSAARGENWVWQTVMPAYAQATAMAVNDLFRTSTLVPGDMPLPQLGCYTLGYPQLKQNQTLLAQCSQATTAATTACKAQNVVAEGELCKPPPTGGWHKPVSYRFWAGSQSVAVYVRKHNSKSIYLIYGTIQPQSNQIGNAPLAMNVSIRLDGSSLAFEVRRQGSTYVFDNTTSRFTKPTSNVEWFAAAQPSWIQIDAWHEATHPAYWSKSMIFEAEAHAELADDVGQIAVSFTEGHALEGLDGNGFDFVGATSFVSVSPATPSAPTKYLFRARRETRDLTAWVRLRRATVEMDDVTSNNNSTCVGLGIDGRVFGTVGCAQALAPATFCWTRVGLVPNAMIKAETTQALTLHGGQSNQSLRIDVDQLGLFVAAEEPSENLC